ncbi:MAG: hypothetical protein J6S67_10185 [Methanobrevibacter sp.]|nr:hypothetical protein [Methanobrevibacter sp.]
MKQCFKDLNIKERLAIISAISAFILGWIMSIAGFWIPPVGEVADSILWILGQALIYAASVFGVTSYFSAETLQMKKDINAHIEQMERLALEREKLRQNVVVDDMPNEIREDEQI